jgi:hypothetical protein
MMYTFRTNLNCQSCVATVTPHLNAAGLQGWRVDTTVPEKLLFVDGDPAAAKQAVEAAGFRVLGEVQRPTVSLSLSAPPPPDEKTTYRPVLLLIALLALATALLEYAEGHWHWHRVMPRFMGGFFLAFAYFKLLNIRAFADAFGTYDLLAARSRYYALAYPFVELLLGILYLANIAPFATNLATLLLMLLGTAGVVRTLLAGRKVKCACLGSVFNLPMSYVTLAEDAIMALMAGAMLM